MKETRETRISEYHGIPDVRSPPVLGLREGSLLLVKDDKITLKGIVQSARLFVKDEPPKEYPVESDLSFLLQMN